MFSSLCSFCNRHCFKQLCNRFFVPSTVSDKKNTVGAVYVTNAESITNDHFAVFFPCKNSFSTFFFLHLKLRTIFYKKQEKKVRKNFVLEGEKLSSKEIFFFIADFLPPFSLAANNFH
jgi:hypothetical protein